MRTIRATSYVSYQGADYSRRKTLLFALETADVPQDKLIESRVGFKTVPTTPKRRAIDLSKAPNAKGIYGTKFADLIVTDDSHEIIGLVSNQFIQTEFKLPDLIERAKEVVPTANIEDWNAIFQLTSEEKALLLLPLIMAKCQRTRQSEEQYLGYKKLSWEEFGRQFTTIMTDDSDNMVYAFPKEKHDTILITDEHSNKQLGISFGDHTGDGTESTWIRNLSNGTGSDFWNGKIGDILVSSDTERLSKAIANHIVDFSTPKLAVGSLTHDATMAPSFIKGLTYQQLLPEVVFDLPTIIKFAKELGLKNFSTRTKAELSIMIGEHLASLPPEDPSYSLIFTSDTAPNLSDIETLTRDNPAYLKSANLSIRDYYLFTSRVIGNIVYAPHASGSAAGRTPTDGYFPGYYGVKPLQFLD